MNRARPFVALLLTPLLWSLLFFGCQASTKDQVKGEPGAEPSTAAGAPSISAIKTESTGAHTTLVFESAGPIEFNAVSRPEPPAIILETNAGRAASIEGLTFIREGLVEKVEVTPIDGRPDASRIEIGLVEASAYQVDTEGDNLLVTVDSGGAESVDQRESLPAAAMAVRELDPEMAHRPASVKVASPSEPAKIQAVEYTPRGPGGGTRLTVKTSKVVQPRIVTRDAGQTLVLNLAPAYIPGDLARPMDTSHFVTQTVRSIKPRQEKNKKVAFTIRLNEAVPYNLTQVNDTVMLDFDASASTPDLAERRRYDPDPVKEATLWRQRQYGVREPGLEPEDKRIQKPRDQKTREEAEAEEEGLEVLDEKGAKKVYTGAKISLDFQKADIQNVLRLISEISGKNIVVTENVSGKVTLKLKEIPWDQALDVVLSANNLGKTEEGDVIKVDTIEALAEAEAIKHRREKERTQKEALEPLEKRVFTPRYRAANDLAGEMSKLLVGEAEYQDELRADTAFGSDIDVARDQAINAPAPAKRGSVTVIGNDIYVECEADVMVQMEEIFYKYDRPAQQVLIEARIIEATDEFSRQLGINWAFNKYSAGKARGVYNPTTGQYTQQNIYGGEDKWRLGAAAINLVDVPTSGMGIAFSLISEMFDLDAELLAMEATGQGRIVSAPRILAQNDEEVYISQGTQVPYESRNNLGEVEIKFKDATLMLAVKPHVEENGEVISMDILVTKNAPLFTQSPTNPPIDTKEAKTRLMVRDGETVVIGGIVQDDQQKRSLRVPGLHRLPLLGNLFKSQEISNTKKELLIFLNANIIPVTI
jgi:type IV pilus assembly protein PilQ